MDWDPLSEDDVVIKVGNVVDAVIEARLTFQFIYALF